MQLEAEKKGLKVSALELSEHEDGYQIDRQAKIWGAFGPNVREA